MEAEDYDIEYLMDQAILAEERRLRMEAEYQEAEYEEQLPAKITLIKTPREHENTTNG